MNASVSDWRNVRFNFSAIDHNLNAASNVPEVALY